MTDDGAETSCDQLNIPFKWAAIRIWLYNSKSMLCLVVFPRSCKYSCNRPSFLFEGGEVRRRRRKEDVSSLKWEQRWLPPPSFPLLPDVVADQQEEAASPNAHRPSPILPSAHLPPFKTSCPPSIGQTQALLQDILRCTWSTWSTALKPDLPGRRSKLYNKCNTLLSMQGLHLGDFLKLALIIWKFYVLNTIFC